MNPTPNNSTPGELAREFLDFVRKQNYVVQWIQLPGTTGSEGRRLHVLIPSVLPPPDRTGGVEVLYDFVRRYFNARGRGLTDSEIAAAAQHIANDPQVQ